MNDTASRVEDSRDANAADIEATRDADHVSVISHFARRLALLSEYRLHGNSQHIRRIYNFTLLTATALGLDAGQAKTIAEASQLHDLGMIAVPDSIVLKPGTLTREERITMESHTTVGGQLIGRLANDLICTARAIILSHHEKWDGSGCPNKIEANLWRSLWKPLLMTSKSRN